MYTSLRSWGHPGLAASTATCSCAARRIGWLTGMACTPGNSVWGAHSCKALSGVQGQATQQGCPAPQPAHLIQQRLQLARVSHVIGQVARSRGTHRGRIHSCRSSNRHVLCVVLRARGMHTSIVPAALKRQAAQQAPAACNAATTCRPHQVQRSHDLPLDLVEQRLGCVDLIRLIALSGWLHPLPRRGAAQQAVLQPVVRVRLRAATSPAVGLESQARRPPHAQAAAAPRAPAVPRAADAWLPPPRGSAAACAPGAQPPTLAPPRPSHLGNRSSAPRG